MTAVVTNFISIDPSPEFSEVIGTYKQTVRQLVGEQVYLNEPPHMTAYLGCFAEDTDVTQPVMKLAESLLSVTIDINGWHVFDADPMTGDRTLVIHFDERSQDLLRDMQVRIGSAFKGIYDAKATSQRYAAAIENFLPEQREAIAEVGFPYWGEGWHPHFTIASVRSTDWTTVADHLMPNPPSRQIVCPSLTLYRVVDNESHPIRTFKLQ